MSARYLFTSANRMHWIGLERAFPDAILACGGEYGPEFLRRRRESVAGAKAMMAVFVDDAVESVMRELGVPVYLPPSRVRDAVEDKCEAVRIAREAGVALAPTVLCALRGYADLRRVAEEHGLGDHPVVQAPHGNSGTGTFTILDEADYDRAAAVLERAPACRVMKRLTRPQSICVENVITDAGVIVGAPTLDLVGVPELTPNPNGWCGNVLGGGVLSERLSEAVRAASMKAAHALRRLRPEYVGYSGDDFLLEEGAEVPVYQEKNARFTGAMPLSNVAALELGLPPLLAQHIDQFEGRGANVPAQALHEAWGRSAGLSHAVCLVVKQLAGHAEGPETLPPFGLYRLEGGRAVRIAETADPSALRPGEGTVLWSPEKSGKAVREQDVLGRLLSRERLTEGNALSDVGRVWIQAIRAEIY